MTVEAILTRSEREKQSRADGYADAGRKRIGFFGYFGSGNSGNDGSLETVLSVVRARFPAVRVLCVCAEPDKVAPRLGVDCIRINWKPKSRLLQQLDTFLFHIPREIGTLVQATWRLAKLDVLIIPGTGILDDFCTGPGGMPYWLFRWILLARLMGTRVVFVSIGAGPIHHPLSRWLMKAAAGMACFRSYRDQYSLAYMRSIGFDTGIDRVYPDVAFALPEPSGASETSAEGAPVAVAVGIMYYNGWRSDDASERIYKSYLAKMRHFLSWLTEEGYPVRIIMGDGIDQSTLDSFLTAPTNQAEPSLKGQTAETLHDVMSQIATTDVVVATRYHNVVCALKLGRPVLSIGYAAKNDELMADMGLAEFCQRIETLDVDELISQFRKLVAGRKFYETRIREKTKRYREELSEQEQLLFRDYL
ncbi:MAG TPA: polysaccharide pyruvyl transferase family protein [Hyphomicrobium sp.]|nr:polysaccharide pyruvyl transferase family protein [Hyphomicrobium sp.]